MLWMMLACSTPEPGHPVKAVVVEVTADDEVLLDHEEIPGLMSAMTMPFRVDDPRLLEGLEPGHKVAARLEIGESGGVLTKIDIVGKGPAPPVPQRAPAPLRVGQKLKSTPVRFNDGSTGELGVGNGAPMALTFIYTRCPMPDFCPATMAKFLALQELVEPPVQLVAVTLDPEFDSDEVLTEFGTKAGTKPDRWKFATATDLDGLALAAGMSIVPRGGEILHAKRVLILDAEGKMLARYDDLEFPIAEAARLLKGTP